MYNLVKRVLNVSRDYTLFTGTYEECLERREVEELKLEGSLDRIDFVIEEEGK